MGKMKQLVVIALLATTCYGGIPGFSDPQDSPQQPRSDLQFGDMSLTTKQLDRIKKGLDVTPDQNSYAASNNPYHRWPNAIIPYEFDCSLEFMPSAHEAVKKAMAEWEKKTCIRFVKRTTEKDYLHFFRDTHCWGNVGRIGGASRISIGYGCDYQHVMAHEIGHVVGFWHEQNRQDRDQWVKIHWENIDDWVKDAFRLVKESDSLGIPYDYASIMHYPWHAFSKNGKITMEPLKQVQIEPYQHVSDGDAKQTALMYKCNEVMRKRRAVEKLDLPGKINHDDDDNCKDKSVHCAAWAKSGACSNNPAVFQQCQTSCKSPMCDPNVKCVDEMKECPTWKEWGHCELNPTVAKLCRKSCSPYCSTTPTGRPSTDVPATNPPATDVPATNAPITNPGTSGPDTGGPLPTTSQKTIRLGYGILCEDRNSQCETWAKSGECENNPGWMLKNCMKSCKVTTCDNGVQRPPGKCADPLGLAFDGKGWKIPDSAFYATSYLEPGSGWNAGSANARLYFGDDYDNKRIGAWCLKSWEHFKGAYLQVDLQARKTINYIATQGRDKYFERVRKFKIGYSDDGKIFHDYQEDGKTKVFDGNCDHFTPILNKFKNSIQARYIRYYPTEANFPCVRMELYGC